MNHIACIIDMHVAYIPSFLITPYLLHSPQARELEKAKEESQNAQQTAAKMEAVKAQLAHISASTRENIEKSTRCDRALILYMQPTVIQPIASTQTAQVNRCPC